MNTAMQLLLMGGRFDPNRHFFGQTETGDWWDPSDLPLMYQDSAGTTGSAVNQPVGLMLGQRYKGQRGAELIVQSAWTAPAGWSVTAGGVATGTAVTGSLRNNGTGATKLTVGKWYEATIRLVSYTSGSVGYPYDGTGFVTIPTAPGTYTYRFLCDSAADDYVYVFGNAFTGVVDSISVREVPGIHRYQTTAPNRLTLNSDGSSSYNGTNSSLVAASGGGATSGFFFCTAVRPSAGAGTARTLWSDTGTNTGWRVRINASNQLELAGGNGTTYTTAATVGTLPVGETHVITCWHDGANLCAQIDGGAIATAALASVSAGSAGFTTGCDNGAASSYYAGKMWASIYRTGTPVTDSLRVRVQRDIARRAGIVL